MKGHIEIVQERVSVGSVSLRVYRIGRPQRAQGRMLWILYNTDDGKFVLMVYGHEMLWAYGGTYTHEELLKVLTLVWNSPIFNEAWELE